MNKNKLSSETSPYLLQHKDNPVHWQAWNQETLDEAERLNKPILLSIGYAACHWCHVMAHESFEDNDVADVMNQHFINIKVDREERPDIDSIYMSALHFLGEQGGWPLTMFLTPKAEPFWGGTYFPKSPRYGHPGFIEILQQISYVFQKHPEKISENQSAIVSRLKSLHKIRDAEDLDPEILSVAAKNIFDISDPEHGGLSGSPKFPQTFMYEHLWRMGLSQTNEPYKKAAIFALERISMGGIYDHLGGGYARYSVDDRWLVPHFEKMLYDNALLISLITMVWPSSKSEILKQRVAETISWLEREMLTPAGGLASSLDADSEGVEGKFYVWTLQEISNLLEPNDANLFSRHYDIQENGNWEGVSVPNRLHASNLADKKTEIELARIRIILLEARSKRIRPGQDDKILCDWNGLAITAISRASLVFDRPEWLKLAKSIFSFITNSMTDGERLFHSYREGKTKNAGQLSDYANMIQAALSLYERTLETEYLDWAMTWIKTLESHFIGNNSFFYMVADDETDLLLRPVSAKDDATPNGNGVMVDNYSRISHLTNNLSYRDRADQLIRAFTTDIMENPLSHCAMLNSYHQSDNQVQISILSKGNTDQYISELNQHPLLNPIVLIGAEKSKFPNTVIPYDEIKCDENTVAFVCKDNACLPKAENVETFKMHLNQTTNSYRKYFGN